MNPPGYWMHTVLGRGEGVGGGNVPSPLTARRLLEPDSFLGATTHCLFNYGSSGGSGNSGSGSGSRSTSQREDTIHLLLDDRSPVSVALLGLVVRHNETALLPDELVGVVCLPLHSISSINGSNQIEQLGRLLRTGLGPEREEVLPSKPVGEPGVGDVELNGDDFLPQSHVWVQVERTDLFLRQFHDLERQPLVNRHRVKYGACSDLHVVPSLSLDFVGRFTWLLRSRSSGQKLRPRRTVRPGSICRSRWPTRSLPD